MNTVLSQQNEVTVVIQPGNTAISKQPLNPPVNAPTSFFLVDDPTSTGGSGWSTGFWSSIGWGS